jgi:hypothetical protein
MKDIFLKHVLRWSSPEKAGDLLVSGRVVFKSITVEKDNAKKRGQDTFCCFVKNLFCKYLC